MAASKMNLVDPDLELSDPNPDIHELFMNFNVMFFNNLLGSVELKWSPRMTLCAGLCRYVGRNGQCSIHLSKPLLSLRSRKDLIETLLHEMIHAYLFVVDRNKERESHGPKFQELMRSINKQSGTNITIYHSFHDEVKHFKVHWWQCDGPCKAQAPYFGLVKRSMNRAPGPSDIWYADHKRKCNGKFNKIKEPTPKKSVKVSRKRKADQIGNGTTQKISDIFPKTSKVPKKKKKQATELPIEDSGHSTVKGDTDKPLHKDENTSTAPNFDSPKKQVNFYGIVPFSGKGNTVGGKLTLDQRRGPKEHPLFSKWKQTENKSDKELSKGVKTEKNLDEPKPGSSKDQAEKPNDGDLKNDKDVKVTAKKEYKRVVCFSSSSEDETIVISSDDEEKNELLCPACGIEYKEFLQTLEEHLQGCEMLADW